MVIHKTVCSECKSENRDRPSYCPDCGAEDPWEDVPQYKFDDEDLPYIFESSFSNDNWGLWDDFCTDYFGIADLQGDDIAGLPDDFPRMKHRFVTVYWVIQEDLELEGPFLTKSQARDSLNDQED